MAQRALQAYLGLNKTWSYLCYHRKYLRMVQCHRTLHTLKSKAHCPVDINPTTVKYCCNTREPCSYFSVKCKGIRLHNHDFSTLNCSKDLTEIGPKGTSTVRNYSTKFNKDSLSLENQLFKDYMHSLEEEFDGLNVLKDSSPQRFGHKENIELQKLEPIVEAFRNVKQKYEDLTELEVLEKDEEMKGLVEKEKQDILTVIHELEEELVSMLTAPEQVDSCDIILEIESGAGGQESMLFAEEIFNMYRALAARMAWKFEVIEIKESKLEKGERYRTIMVLLFKIKAVSGALSSYSDSSCWLIGYHSASASVSGNGVYQQMKYEGGVHRVQRVPATETKGRMHTSTVTVAILPEPKEIDIQIEKKDLHIEAMRSSGPGGQNVNKVNSACRIVHLPSGIVSECQETRSYSKNEELALKKLKSRLYERLFREEASKTVSQRKIQVGNKDRSEKIRTYNFPQDRITDHRIGHSVHNMPSFLTAGQGLSDIMDRVQEGAKYEAIQSQLDEFDKSRSQAKEIVRKKR